MNRSISTLAALMLILAGVSCYCVESAAATPAPDHEGHHAHHEQGMHHGDSHADEDCVHPDCDGNCGADQSLLPEKSTQVSKSAKDLSNLLIADLAPIDWLTTTSRNVHGPPTVAFYRASATPVARHDLSLE